MKTLTKANIETLANEIITFLEINTLASDVSLYFNDKVMRGRHKWDKDDNYIVYWVTEDNVDPHTYFEYAAYDHILSMSFEGPLYNLLNYSCSAEFDAIFEKYGLYYEFGNAWNLTAYTSRDMDVEYTQYSRPKEPIYLSRWREDNPTELQAIMDKWYELSKAIGDKGSCVLGAGFHFEWQGNEYFMSACSPWQGSLSWEAHIDTIKELLKDVGATEIYYNYGRMD